MLYAPNAMPAMGASIPPEGGLLSPGPSFGGSGLLDAAQSYRYPLTTGLLGALTQSQTPQPAADWSLVALQLAGNPHAGPYANAPGFQAASGPSAGQTSGGSTGAQIVGGLLGALKNPQVAKGVGNAVNGLLGPSLSSADAATWASGAPANSAVASQLGNVANDGTASAVRAANDAALAGTAAGANLSSLDNFGSGAAANGAVASELGNVANDGTAASVQASNDASLNATNGGSAGAASALGAAGDAYGIYSGVKSGTPQGYAQAAGDAYKLYSSGALAYAAPVAIAMAPYLLGHFMSTRDNSSSGYYGIGGVTDLANTVKQATDEYGPLSAQSKNPAQAALWNEVASNPTDPKVQGLIQAMDDLTQLQVGVNGALGTLSPYAQQLLNNMGYQSLTQEENAPGVLKPGYPGFVGGGGGGSSRGEQRK